MPFFDTHAHLYDERLAGELPSILDRAQSAGVTRILTLGIDAESSQISAKQAEQHPMLLAAVGIQPNSVAEALPGDWDIVLQLSESSPRVAAVGETGLDRYWDRAPFPLQMDYFSRHLELAHRLQKPVVIHCREAEADVESMVREHYEKYGPVSGVMHSYCGDAEYAKRFLAMGLHISFAGMITYKTAESIRQVARTIPADRILIETDSPYLAPVPHRGKRNEPAFVVHTAAAIAEFREISLEEFGRITTQNAESLFENPSHFS